MWDATPKLIPLRGKVVHSPCKTECYIKKFFKKTTSPGPLGKCATPGEAQSLVGSALVKKNGAPSLPWAGAGTHEDTGGAKRSSRCAKVTCATTTCNTLLGK